MKRIWFSVAFLAIALSVCVAEQYIVKTSCREIVSSIDSALTAQDENEKEKYCEEAVEKWDDYFGKAAYITDHSILQNADISMGEVEQYIKSDVNSADDALIEAKSEIEQINEVSKINLANVF